MTYRELLARYLAEAGLNTNRAANLCTARGCRIHRTYLSKILNGRLPPPSAEVSRTLAEVCGQDPEPLVVAGYREKAPAPVRRLLEEVWGGGEPGEEEVTYLPALGRVPAGRPILSEETEGEAVPVPARLARGSHFALRIEGDSMVGAGIEDGDYVVVRRQPAAESGEVVVARLAGGEVTCKRLEKLPGRPTRLLPANPRYAPLGGEFELVGVVRAVVKTLR